MKMKTLLLTASVLAAALVRAGVPKIIFDTDMYTDYDDVGALAILHALADAGECEIVAVGCNTWGEGNRSVAACEVVNAYYGRGDLPVGCARHGGRTGKGADGHGLPAKYPQWVRHLDTATAPLAVDVYRKALEAAPDKSVVLCSVGFLNNVADLLMTDRALVERKVRLWVCMACQYPNGEEYNSKCDPPASDYAFRNWPKGIPVVWTDFQYGLTCYAGRAVAELPGAGNPVRDAFAARLMPRDKIVPGKSWDQLAGHPSWDETAVLIAVRGWEPFFNLERGRYEMVGDRGANRWIAEPASANGRVTEKLTRAEVGQIIDELMCRKPLVRKEPVDYVDPLIGTTRGGNTFPGVTTPFGMIQTSPDTVGRNRVSGYNHADTRIRGFSQTHLSGTGCGGLGDLVLMPFTETKDDADFSSAFSKSRQSCAVDRYGVHLDDFDVDAEATASPRVGWWRFTWNGEGPKRLLVDAATTILLSWAPQYGPWIPESEMHLSDDRTEITGSRRVKGWSEYKLYYVVKLDRPFAAKRILARDPFEGMGDRVVLDFDLKKGETLGVRVALSLKSVEGARRNLESESKGQTFETVRAATRAAWADVVSRMTVKGGTEDQKKLFYTSLYHLFIQPNLISDVGEEEEYSTFSLWDTFRAAHPLYTIVAPEKVPAFVRSMLRHGKRHGHLPMWEFWGEENHCMVGWPAIPVIVDAYLKGLLGPAVAGGSDSTVPGRGGDSTVPGGGAVPRSASYCPCPQGQTIGNEILTQVIDTLTRCDEKHDQMSNVMWEHGYYPCDKGRFTRNFTPGWNASRTLEIAYDWWCADALARALGNARAVKGCARYVNCWKNLWDAKTGFMRPKNWKGQWLEPFHPETTDPEPGRDWPEFTEASAWIYTWHVFQDPAGLAALMGGPEKACRKLDRFFGLKPGSTAADVDFPQKLGFCAHDNEPSHHIPYLYAVWGEPHKTAALVRRLCDTYTATPAFFPGANEDCGQMSAWYLFSAAGFYPLNPCGGDYVLGAPQFPEVTFRLAGGKTFTVTAENLSKENKFVKDVSPKGVVLRHADLIRGGTLKFTMDNERLLIRF